MSQNLITVLSKCKLFNGLDSNSLELIQSFMDIEIFNCRDYIIKEGTTGDKLFIVKHGKVEIVQGLIFNINRILKTLTKGDSFGEIALISDSPVRTASAIALEDNTVCMSLTKSNFNFLLEKYPKIALQILKTFYERDKENIVMLTQDLRNSFYSIMAAMGVMAEFRDPETGAHLTRTSLFSTELVKCLVGQPDFEFIDKSFVELIGLSSPLHDIGKVGIPDEILLKPGKLTKEEFDVMKMHPEYGGDVLKKTIKFFSYPGFLKMGVNITTYHHERWNGAGYPGGLKGEQIPLEARIMALCDVYDALRSERPYKKPLSRDKSLDIIILEKGRHFDPKIVEAFINIESIFNAIFTQNMD